MTNEEKLRLEKLEKKVKKFKKLGKEIISELKSDNLYHSYGESCAKSSFKRAHYWMSTSIKDKFEMDPYIDRNEEEA